MEPDDPIRIELTDELDLHPFHPRDVAGIVQDYLDHACAQGWTHVRIVHGKGIGALRETVHRVLEKHPAVTGYGPGGDGGGGWGATRVRLDPARGAA